MNFAEYVTSISFKYLQPDTPLTPENMQIFKEGKGRFPEATNTQLPNESEMKPRFYELSSIPRMSTYAIAAIINYGVSQMDSNSAYVNVGIWQGFTFLAGVVGNEDKTCIGIDNFSCFLETGTNSRDEFSKRWENYRSSRHRFYEMDYQDYFKNVHQEPIGFYFYDGDHAYEHQLKGLQIAEPFFVKNSIVLVDDTNAEGPYQATLDFIANSQHHYDVLLDKKTSFNPHPTFWNGVMVLQKH